jgi:hypothetical protein
MTPQEHVEARQAEVAAYDANIAVYNSVYAGLPKDWPDHLLKYRKAKNQHQIIDEVEDIQDVNLLSQLWYADQVHNLIRTEILERTKAAAILAALEAAGS